MGDLIDRRAAIDALAEWHDAAITNRLNNLPSAQSTIYGYDIKDLIIFADAVKKKEITESEIHEFVLNAKSAWGYAWEEFQKTQKEALDLIIRGDNHE